MMRGRPGIFVTLLILFAHGGISQDKWIEYNSGEGILPVGARVYQLVDPSNALTFDQILDAEFQQQFELPGQELFNEPAAHVTYWFRMHIHNKSDEELWLEFGEKFAGWEIDVFRSDSAGNYAPPLQSGSLRLANQDRLSRSYKFKISEPDHPNPVTIHIRLRTGIQLNVRPRIGPLAMLEEEEFMNSVIFLGFLGVIIAMFFYNLFIYISLRDSIYLYYLAYLFCIGFTIPFDSGNPVIYHPWLWEKFFVWHSIPFYAIALFAVRYLKISKRAPKFMYVIVPCWAFLSLILPILNFFDLVQFATLLTIFQGVLFIFYLTLFGSSIFIWKIKKHRNARFYTLGWGYLILTIFVYIAALNGILPMGSLAPDIMYFGFAGEAMLFALALGDRFVLLRNEKELIQRRNLSLVQDQKIDLEKQVNEKTEELQLSNKELKEALIKLRQAQDHLIQTEKMASIGTLAAGFAHEINNPLNFIMGGARYLDEYIRENKMGSKDVNETLKTIQDGVDRAAGIVKNLTQFSRNDQDTVAPCNVHELLDDSIMFLNTIHGNSIRITKRYTDEVGRLEANKSKLRQVFMNLIQNSLDALDDNGTIEITTSVKASGFTILVRDNGHGISQKDLKKVFDPFFTTKDPGKGTGLGLFICYNVIQEHGGNLEIDSQMGVGTRVIIELPLAQTNGV